MASTDAALTVQELNNYAKSLLENDARLSSVRVQGELTGFKRHTSGHLYFSLKDENALIRCVMFRSSAVSLRFSPKDGMKVILRGSVSLYVKDGQYQFYAVSMHEAGEGELYRQFLELKARLEAEGLFDRKRPIPFLPRCVGIVTSETGAALHDIVTVIRRRFPTMRMIFAPAQVQGPSAPPSIVEAIRMLNESGRPDVLIVGRGGGSYEDLFCFNDESVARAIRASRIPVISAVGHEVDFTIADFAADLRAPTPSAAAELCVPELDALLNDIDTKREKLDLTVRNAMTAAKKQIELMKGSAALSRPAALIEQKRAALEALYADLPKNRTLVFVGDGINDAPALKRADVGVAMGALGSDAAIEAADAVISADSPGKLIDAVRIADRTHRITIENIIFALGMKAVFLLLGALGLANLWIAVFGDVGVMLLAVLNAMRVFLDKRKED